MKKYKAKIINPFIDTFTELPVDENGYFNSTHSRFRPEAYPDMFEEVKQPLFVTEDGLEVWGLNITLYGVWKTSTEKGLLHGVIEVKTPTEEDFTTKGFLLFYRKEAAEAWIKENKPKFSEKQVLDAIAKNSYTHVTEKIKNTEYLCNVNGIKKELGL